ncbi:hypothetical protein [Breznakia pachnodae]|jgi:hypothetical protein|uniref:Uncharacterized protein n=1 Tax=Breznakia pachnodae TaxID=265178 RepID=A0ABU0E3A4_9FIRM|nr:hypothetical protein [Breznakia pachnodae]MDQ0361377.1 hypothetical protein [Breznakia pachnodae]
MAEKRPKPKFRDLMKKREVEEGKDVDLEKGDFLAILIAAASVILPVILGLLLFIFLFITVWGWIF